MTIKGIARSAECALVQVRVGRRERRGKREGVAKHTGSTVSQPRV